uniref:Uncharacterized protein n=1 Tax=Zea mays TaxID=4577 RepID=B6TXT4_MAIZE|nr:hypothetical protein [Zea mays]
MAGAQCATGPRAGPLLLVLVLVLCGFLVLLVPAARRGDDDETEEFPVASSASSSWWHWHAADGRRRALPRPAAADVAVAPRPAPGAREVELRGAGQQARGPQWPQPGLQSVAVAREVGGRELRSAVCVCFGERRPSSLPVPCSCSWRPVV